MISNDAELKTMRERVASLEQLIVKLRSSRRLALTVSCVPARAAWRAASYMAIRAG
jgi:hypothetical protein